MGTHTTFADLTVPDLTPHINAGSTTLVAASCSMQKTRRFKAWLTTYLAGKPGAIVVFPTVRTTHSIDSRASLDNLGFVSHSWWAIMASVQI